MLFQDLLRRELARAALARAAEALAVDVLPRRNLLPRTHSRSSSEHLRNGFGALLDVASLVAWRRSVLATMVYASRRRARSELIYGLGELGRAGALPRSVARTTGLRVVALAGGAATAAYVIRKRRSADAVTLVPRTVSALDEPVPAFDEPVRTR